MVKNTEHAPDRDRQDRTRWDAMDARGVSTAKHYVRLREIKRYKGDAGGGLSRYSINASSFLWRSVAAFAKPDKSDHAAIRSCCIFLRSIFFVRFCRRSSRQADIAPITLTCPLFQAQRICGAARICLITRLAKIRRFRQPYRFRVSCRAFARGFQVVRRATL